MRTRSIPPATERDLTFLLDFVARMRQALGEVAVIRKDEETFGLRVEPADIEEAWQMRRQQIEDRVARVRIVARGDETRRLMEHDVEPALAVNQFAVNFDVVAVCRLGAEVSAHLAID